MMIYYGLFGLGSPNKIFILINFIFIWIFFRFFRLIKDINCYFPCFSNSNSFLVSTLLHVRISFYFLKFFIIFHFLILTLNSIYFLSLYFKFYNTSQYIHRFRAFLSLSLSFFTFCCFFVCFFWVDKKNICALFIHNYFSNSSFYQLSLSLTDKLSYPDKSSQLFHPFWTSLSLLPSLSLSLSPSSSLSLSLSLLLSFLLLLSLSWSLSLLLSLSWLLSLLLSLSLSLSFSSFCCLVLYFFWFATSNLEQPNSILKVEIISYPLFVRRYYLFIDNFAGPYVCGVKIKKLKILFSILYQKYSLIVIIKSLINVGFFLSHNLSFLNYSLFLKHRDYII